MIALVPSTSVRADLLLDAERPTSAALLVSVAARPGVEVRAERLTLTGPGGPLPVQEVRLPDGTRLHEFEVPAGSTAVEYEADVRVDGAAASTDLTAAERWEFARPSRFCPSDRFSHLAAREFARFPRAEQPRAVAAWVRTHTDYVSGSSGPSDSALETLVGGQGVCRDFAHLVVALLRALDVPARVAAVYAPGLSPMDFHAVAEAAPDGRWQVVDATGLAPRQSLVRIASGRDTADTAFLTTAGPVTLTRLSVLAVTDGALPSDDGSGLVRLA